MKMKHLTKNTCAFAKYSFQAQPKVAVDKVFVHLNFKPPASNYYHTERSLVLLYFAFYNYF